MLTGPLAALDARISREVLRLRARYELSLDEFRGLYISDEQVDRLIDAAHVHEPRPSTAGLARPSDKLRATDDRWARFAEAFSLSPLEEDLLLIAIAPELSLKYETLFAYLNDDVTRKWPTTDLALRLLEDVTTGEEVSRALSPAGPLRSRRLVRRVDAASTRPTLLGGGYALDPCVVHWVRRISPGLALESDAIQWLEPVTAPDDEVARERAEPVLRLLARWSPSRGSLPVFALIGSAGSGREEMARAVASGFNRPLVQIDLHALADNDTDPVATLDRTAVALTLVPAVILLEGIDPPTHSEGERKRDAAWLKGALARLPASALIMVRATGAEPLRAVAGSRRVIEIRCDDEGFERRVQVWKDAARREGIDLPSADCASLAGRFSLTAGQVRTSMATACDLAMMTGDEPPGAEQIAASARLASDQSLGRLALKVDRKHHWNDLVLPGATLRRLREFMAAIRHRHVVFGEWRFGERIVNGAGIKALFAGASGTGKTMAAGVIARELGLDLFKVDLSGVVSKYIGETEKNLDRIFRAAKCSNAIVFLDEAEAIMGKRSEVKDAHDRYANIEVAYLLQRLEEHDGVVILATNLKRNIDEAFNRRMQYVIDFPRPEEPERERIWRGMFPAEAPLAPDVDFPFLARQFDLAGGDIRNVALDAAFIAAQDGGAIDMRAVIEALSRQLAKQGKTPTGTDFRQYQRLRPVAGGAHDVR